MVHHIIHQKIISKSGEHKLKNIDKIFLVYYYRVSGLSCDTIILINDLQQK